MWLTAVVDRLVVRNTSVSNVKAAARIFVRAWAEFSSEVLVRARESNISSAGENENINKNYDDDHSELFLEDLRELETLLSEVVLHEIEKVLMEETGKELLESVSLNTSPELENIQYIGKYSYRV